MGALTLADGRTRVDVMLTQPSGWDTSSGVLELSLSDLEDAIYASPQINKPDFRMSPSGSDTVADQPQSTRGNATTFGASNWDGSITALRLLDDDGLPEGEDLLDAVGYKGARAWYLKRQGPISTEPLAVGHKGVIIEYVTDDPQDPTNVEEGYLKKILPLGYQDVREFEIVNGG